jgi:hypothetical protein
MSYNLQVREQILQIQTQDSFPTMHLAHAW